VASTQVTDETWNILRGEGAIIEEALGDSSSLGGGLEAIVEEGLEDVGGDRSSLKDEKTTSPSAAVVDTSFNEKPDGLHGYQMNVVDIHPDEHPPDDEDGQGLL
jgi:hypothetical protein